MIEVKKLKNWNPPDGWIEFQTIDAHTEGEPLRIILSGYPELKGKTLLQKRSDAKNYHDELRKALIWEPRGHADMYGAIIVEPDTTGADFGVIFIHNEGYSTGCGSCHHCPDKSLCGNGIDCHERTRNRSENGCAFRIH